MLSTLVLPRPQLRERSTSPVVSRSKSGTFSKSPTTRTRRRTKTVSSGMSPDRDHLVIPLDISAVEIISSSSPKRGRALKSTDDLTDRNNDRSLRFDVPMEDDHNITSVTTSTQKDSENGAVRPPLHLVPSFEVTGTNSLDGASDRENVTVDEIVAESNPTTTTPSDTRNDSIGIFSSILNAANNIISSKDDDDVTRSKRASFTSLISGGRTDTAKKRYSLRNNDDTFENKLDSLLGKHESTLASVGAADNSLVLNGTIDTPNATNEDPGITSSNIIDKNNTGDRSSLPTSVVQFESVRDSPLNTLGKGDLSLASFDKRLSRTSEMLGDSDILSHLGSPSLHGTVSNGVRNPSMPRSVSIDSKISHFTSRNAVPMAQTISKSVAEDGPNDVMSTTEPSLSNSDSQENSGSLQGGESLKFALELKNRGFHQTFKEVPLTDNLIEDCSCALSKEILIQGKMYISSNYICFKSNILGWITNLVIPLSEVVQIEKKSTAGVFPNGIIIRTLHHRYTFATFLSRDNTFTLISKVWRNVLELVPGDGANSGRPRGTSITSSRYVADEESMPNNLADDEVALVDDGELIDEDELEDQNEGNGTINEEDGARPGSSRQRTLTASQLMTRNEDVDADAEASTSTDDNKQKSNGKSSGDDKTFFGFPVVGPMKHAAVMMNYEKQPNDVFISDEVIGAPLGVVFGILFGLETQYIIKILKDQKNFDISEDSILGLSPLLKERNYGYVKPLGGPIGPKQTKCFLVDKLVDYDLEHHVMIETVTLTPDVPSGGSFKVKTRMFLSWAANNQTRIYVLTSVDWSAKSWIKGAVEKGSIEGQKDSMKVMIKDLKEIIDGLKASGSKGDKKKKKKTRTVSSAAAEAEPAPVVKPAEPAPPPPPPTIMEQAKTLLDSIVSLLGSLVEVPFVDATIVGWVLLVVLVFVSRWTLGWMFGGSGRTDAHTVQFVDSDSFVSRVVIDKKEYVVIPGVKSKLADTAFEQDNDAALWRWISKRTHGALDKGDQPGGEKTNHVAPEVLEYIGLAQERLNELAGLH